MTAITMPKGATLKLSPPRALEAAAKLWFATAVAGLSLFLVYILGVYAPSVLFGNYEAWNRNGNLIKGFVPGDHAGNLAFAAHMALAAAVTGGGLIQLVPAVRTRWPRVHRWTGRTFLLMAALASVTGAYMTWVRQANLGIWGAIAISGDAVLILAFGALAWRTAQTRRFAQHRRWALRTFMVANAVWFLRVGFPPLGLLSLALTGSPPKIHSALFIAWNFGCYLLPLGVLRLYFLVQQSGRSIGRYVMAGTLVALTAVMAFGVVGSWFALFAPVLARV